MKGLLVVLSLTSLLCVSLEAQGPSVGDGKDEGVMVVAVQDTTTVVTALTDIVAAVEGADQVEYYQFLIRDVESVNDAVLELEYKVVGRTERLKWTLSKQAAFDFFQVINNGNFSGSNEDFISAVTEKLIDDAIPSDNGTVLSGTVKKEKKSQ